MKTAKIKGVILVVCTFFLSSCRLKNDQNDARKANSIETSGVQKFEEEKKWFECVVTEIHSFMPPDLKSHDDGEEHDHNFHCYNENVPHLLKGDLESFFTSMKDANGLVLEIPFSVVNEDGSIDLS